MCVRARVCVLACVCVCVVQGKLFLFFLDYVYNVGLTDSVKRGVLNLADEIPRCRNHR